MSSDQSSTERSGLLAALLAWVWPGLGHMYIGEKKRGRRIMFGVLFLFISGLLIGGLDCVDSREDRLWFFAQVLSGPIAIVADVLNMRFIKTLPEPQRFAAIGINKPNEIGTLFCALAGLMNFAVILDAMHFSPRPGGRDDHRRRDDAPASPPSA